MSEPFVGEIRMFAGNFAPRGWAFCDGQLLAVSQNDALFSLFGTIYGGDGRTTFGLPELRGRIPIHAGQGPGLTDRRLGVKLGLEAETLTAGAMPAHIHPLANNTPASSGSPAGNAFGSSSANIYANGAGTDPLGGNERMGGSRSHTNLMPFLCVHFIVALFGIYPSRS